MQKVRSGAGLRRGTHAVRIHARHSHAIDLEADTWISGFEHLFQDAPERIGHVGRHTVGGRFTEHEDAAGVFLFDAGNLEFESGPHTAIDGNAEELLVECAVTNIVFRAFNRLAHEKSGVVAIAGNAQSNFRQGNQEAWECYQCSKQRRHAANARCRASTHSLPSEEHACPVSGEGYEPGKGLSPLSGYPTA